MPTLRQPPFVLSTALAHTPTSPTYTDRHETLMTILADLGVHHASPNTTRLTTDVTQPYRVYPSATRRRAPLYYNRPQTTTHLLRALQALLTITRNGGHVLVVAGSPSSVYLWSSLTDRDDYKALPSKARPSRLLKKWPGGLFTNFTAYLAHSLPFVDADGQGRGTGLPRARYEAQYGGMKRLAASGKRPDLTIFLNAEHSIHGVLECAKCGVPSIGFITQSCPKRVFDALDYRVPGNLDTVEIDLFYSERLLWIMTLAQTQDHLIVTSPTVN